MIVKADKLHLKKLLSDAIPLLCKNGLPPHSEFRVEAMIGITVNNSEVALICINETVMADGDIVPQVYGVDEDLDENEELGYPEPGNGPAVNAEECHNGSGTVYGGVIDVEEYGVKQERNDGLEQDMTGYEDAANGVIHPGGYLYDGKMADEVGYGRNTTPRSKKPGSFAVGSDHFVTKEEFDDGTEDCVAVKEELGLDESVFANAFGFQDNARVKSRSSGFRAYKPGANFSSAGETSMQPFPTWQSKTKRMGPLQGRKVPGGKTPAGKTSRNATSLVAPVELQSPGSGSGYATVIQDLCDSIMQQSTQNGEQFACHICGANLSNAKTLRNHIRGTHLALKTERCNICGESFKWAMQLARHKKRDHRDGSFIQIYNSRGGGSREMAIEGEDDY